jgi:ABC-2 type transport system ATP-binding protein
MIEVRDLVKRYGLFEVLRYVNFSVEKGEAVALLGENGAGKTTTMRILSSFVPPTSGSVRVAGRDVVFESDAVRMRLGYMPESVPLYGAMRVEEFLRFRAKLKGLKGKDVKPAVERAMAGVHLTARRRSLIQNLSKGLKQRAGLADALVHDPEVLILDEPTSGLDPTQRVEVRSLLAELKGKHTILISSHILPEIESICDRAVILRKGKVVSTSRIADLKAAGGGDDSFTVTAKNVAESTRATLRALGSVAKIDIVDAETAVSVVVHPKEASARNDVLRALIDGRSDIVELKSSGGSLESAYIAILRGGESAA